MEHEPEIRSGEWEQRPGVADYRCLWLGQVLVERVVWGPEAPELGRSDLTLAGPGYIWFRFWLPRQEQIVERYFNPQGRTLGTQIDICMPPSFTEAGASARDLLLDIWITDEGQVTVSNEETFERAVREGLLGPAEARRAETHIRTLTGAIARGSFPPALVRNWEIDIQQVRYDMER